MKSSSKIKEIRDSNPAPSSKKQKTSHENKKSTDDNAKNVSEDEQNKDDPFLSTCNSEEPKEKNLTKENILNFLISILHIQTARANHTPSRRPCHR